MVSRGQITQTSVKRRLAAALASEIARNELTQGDAGDVLGASASTVANRLKGDCADNQMTVFELVRAVREWGPGMANAIFAEMTGYHLVPISAREAQYGALKVKLSGVQHKIAVAEADGQIDHVEDREIKQELRSLLPEVVNHCGVEA